MFSLIIAIVALALVVSVIIVGNYYGGSTISESAAQAEAVRLKNEEQQLLGAVDVFNADKGRWPRGLDELVEGGYLQSMPQGAKELQARAQRVQFLSTAFAQDVSQGWNMPVASQPVFMTQMKVPKEVCRKFNRVSRGDDGILKEPFASLPSQCYGQDAYTVVVTKSGAVAALPSAVAPVKVQDGNLPGKDTGGIWWDTQPSGDIKVPVDADKTPYAELDLQPTTAWDFGDVQVGQVKRSPAQGVVNRGNIPVQAIAVQVPEGFSVIANSCAAGLNPGASCSFVVMFAPTAAKNYSGDVVVNSSNGGRPKYSVAGVGKAASADLSGIAFGNLAAGATTTRTAVLKNTGVGLLTLGSPAVVGAGFELADSGCDATLRAGESCALSVKFTPNGVTAHTGALKIATQEAGELSAALSGQSQQAVVALDTSSMSFGNVTVGQTSLPQFLTLKNNGNIPATGMASAVASGFGVAGGNTPCSSTLAAGATCDIRVTFSPGAARGYTGNYALTGTNFATQTVSLSGTGTQGYLTLSYPGHGLGSDQIVWNTYVGQTSGSATFTLTNSGNTAATTISLGVPTAWTVSGSTCGSTLAVGAACMFSLSFSPTAVQTYTGTLSVSSSNSSSAGVYGLVGRGVALYSQATLTSSSSQSMSVWYGYSTDNIAFTYRNDGNQAMTLNGPGLSAPLSLVDNSCANVAPGASCSMTVALNSKAAGAGGSSSQMFVPSGATVAPAAATANWTIYSAVPRWSTTSLNFGNVAVGQSVSQTITVYNDGSAPYNWATHNSVLNQPAGFSFDLSRCDSVAPNGGSCQVEVKFTPMASGSYRGEQLWFWNVSYTSNYLSVSGTGV